MCKKLGLDPKDQLLFGAMIIAFGALYNVATDFKSHAQGCEKSTNRMIGLVLTILAGVFIGLILTGINAYHGNNETMRSVTTVEEKVKH